MNSLSGEGTEMGLSGFFCYVCSEVLITPLLVQYTFE